MFEALRNLGIIYMASALIFVLACIIGYLTQKD